MRGENEESMSKYYDKKIPIEINVVYGGRQSGKNYYEFKKLKEEYNKLKKNNFELFKSYERLVNRIGKAIAYIEKSIDSEDIYEHFLSTGETKELLKILKGEEK